MVRRVRRYRKAKELEHLSGKPQLTTKLSKQVYSKQSMGIVQFSGYKECFTPTKSLLRWFAGLGDTRKQKFWSLSAEKILTF